VATDPAFAATVKIGAATLGAVETSLTVPTTTSTIVTAGAAGTKIEEVVINAVAASLVPATVAGLVYLFIVLDSGPTFHLYDVIPVTAVTASATVAPFRANRTWTNFWIASGWSLRASQSNATNANILKCEAFGGDY
jgi:hypothetical protein